MFSLTITTVQLMKKEGKCNTILQNTIHMQYPCRPYILWQNVETILIKITNYQILIAMVSVTRHISIGVPRLYMVIDNVMVNPKVHLIKKK